MQPTPADLVGPFAKILVSSYMGAAADARIFTAEHQYPPTKMHKAHCFRSIVQAQVSQSDRYSLHVEYSEAGRVQVTDHETRQSYLIRSKAMIDIDRATKPSTELALFEVPRLHAVPDLPAMLAYNFNRSGMFLWICPTKQANRESHRLVPVGEIEPLGFWPFDDSTAPPDGGGGLFDQGIPDPFDDLGNPDIDDLGEAGGL